MNENKSGFTMIELIVIIVIIGILAAVAIPRFINQTSNARIAALNGLAGAIRSAASLAKIQYKAEADDTSTSIDMDGTSVDVIAGTGRLDANANGIGTAVRSFSGFVASYDSGTATFNFTTAITDCNVTYNEDTGIAALTTTGC